MRTLPKAILVAMTCCGATVAHGQESHWSVNVMGFSWHENEKQRKDANPINPGIGVRYSFTEKWYGEINRVFVNSLGGETNTLGIGWHTKATEVMEKPLLLGVQLMHMEYKTPAKGTTVGIVPAFTAEWKVVQGINLVVYAFPKPQESVIFVGFNMPL